MLENLRSDYRDSATGPLMQTYFTVEELGLCYGGLALMLAQLRDKPIKDNIVELMGRFAKTMPKVELPTEDEWLKEYNRPLSPNTQNSDGKMGAIIPAEQASGDFYKGNNLYYIELFDEGDGAYYFVYDAEEYQMDNETNPIHIFKSYQELVGWYNSIPE